MTSAFGAEGLSKLLTECTVYNTSHQCAVTQTSYVTHALITPTQTNTTVKPTSQMNLDYIIAV